MVFWEGVWEEVMLGGLGGGILPAGLGTNTQEEIETHLTYPCGVRSISASMSCE